MTKLSGSAVVKREIPLQHQGREVLVTLTPRGIEYRAKGLRSPITFVDHEVAIAAGQKVAARANGVDI